MGLSPSYVTRIIALRILVELTWAGIASLNRQAKSWGGGNVPRPLFC
jgi:hypothetical protein